jgi:molybdenum cofactor cytidylyltransferase
MGRTKALLPWGAGTLLEAWIRRLDGAGIGEIAVVTGADGDVIRASAPPRERLHWVSNPDPIGTGLRESLLLGVDACGPDQAVLWSPVDVPVPGDAVFRLLLDAWAGHGDAFAVVPTGHGRPGHPVLASPRMVRRLFEGERGDRIDELLAWASRQVRRVPVDDDRILRDMDAPEDYLMALERGDVE